MYLNLNKIICLLIFLLNKMTLSTKVEFNTTLFTENSLPLDVERLLLNFVISLILIRENFSEDEEKLVNMILQFIDRSRKKAQETKEANTVYWHLRQGR